MHSRHVDDLARSLHSRRRIMGGLLAGPAALFGLAAAPEGAGAKKACGRGKRKCGKKCIPKAKCCKNSDCPGSRICAKGRCVVGAGTCSVGRDMCVDQTTLSICNAPAAFGCLCFRTTGGKTRCGNGLVLPPGGDSCNDDADCARRHRDVPGVFCTRGGQNGAGGGAVCTTFNYCQAPCPA